MTVTAANDRTPDAGETPSGDTVGTVDVQRVKQDTVRGGGIAFASKACGVVIQLVSTVVLARLLAPSDYGVIAMVAAATAFVSLFRDLGLSTASVQLLNLSRAQQSNLFWINVALGAFLTILTALGAPAVAWFYGLPELTAVTLAMAPSFVIGSMGAQSSAALVRDMLFGRQAVAEIAGAISGVALSIGLATADFSYWSLVWGGLLGTTVSSVLLMLLSPFKVARPCRTAEIGSLLRFGANVTLFGVTEYVHRQVDNILIGRVSGAADLGVYSRAYSLFMVPLQAVRGPVVAVAYPALSKLQQDTNAYIAYLRGVSSAIAMLSIPSYAFGVVASKSIVLAVLGPEWVAAGPIFAWLSLAGMVQPLGVVPGLVNLSLGNSERYRNWGFFKAVGVTVAVCVGIAWGPVGVACGYATCSLALFIPSLLYACSGTVVRAFDVLQDYVRPVLASLPACAALSWLNETEVMAVDSSVLQLLIEWSAFTLVFLACQVAIPGGLRQVVQPACLIKRYMLRTNEQKPGE